jgi:hypothetical protein
MPQDQLQALIDAIRSIKLSGRSAYDYVVLIVPVITGVLGWLLTALWQSRQFRQNSRKEHYYVAVEKVEALTTKYTTFLDYVQSFYDSIRAIINGGAILDSDSFVTFITQYQTRLAEIHHLQRITFPGHRLDSKALIAAMKTIEALFGSMVPLSVESTKVGMSSPPDDVRVVQVQTAVKKFYTDLAAAFHTMTLEVARLEGEMVAILDKRAKPLGLFQK